MNIILDITDKQCKGDCFIRYLNYMANCKVYCSRKNVNIIKILNLTTKKGFWVGIMFNRLVGFL